jgi:hypothetical protein
MRLRVAGAVLASALLLAGCTASAPTGSAPAGSASSASQAASASPSPAAMARLQVGDCIGDIDLSGAAINDVASVPCSRAHSWEVDATVPVPGETYPGASVLAASAKSSCATNFTSYVGVEQQYSRYSSAYLTGDEGAWTVPENRVITCLVGSADGGLVGSAKGDTLIFPEKGQCTGRQDVAAQSVKVIDCKASHYYEVFASKELTGKTAPTRAEEQKLFTSVCQAGFKSFVGVAVGKSKYEVAYFLPGADIWTKVADHRIVCSAGSPQGGIKGSLKGVNK